MSFEEFASVAVLDQAYRKTRRSKRGRRAEAIFESQETERLIRLSEWLLSGDYEPAPLDDFMIYEPKPRQINAPSFRDKIVQRNLTDTVIYPTLVPAIPFNAYAAQTGKGQHMAVRMLEKGMRTYFLRRKAADEQLRKEQGLPYRPIDEWDYANGWVVKGDIRKCFPSTDHEKLKEAVFPKLPDKRFCDLLGRYIDQVPGLALGHQTSHICAVYYMSKALHYINQELKCSNSGMYADDWWLIVDTKEEAKAVLNACYTKFAELGYELNEKTVIYPLRHGIDFCGFRVYITKTGKTITKLRQSSKKKTKRRIRKWAKEYAEGTLTKEKLEEKATATFAHMKHGDTHQLVENLQERVNNIFKEANNEQKD